MKTIEELEKRVAELEAEIARLKSSTQHVIHSHYHYGAAPQPVYQPLQPFTPQWPTPTWGGPSGGNPSGGTDV